MTVKSILRYGVPFDSVFSNVDSHLFNLGIHYKIYESLGSHVTIHDGVEGVKFAVWAPNVPTYTNPWLWVVATS